MTGESTSLFKVFRVLWFPPSFNAIFLGALAALAFVLITWLGVVAVGGSSSMTKEALGGFFGGTAKLISSGGDWPGYSVAEVEGSVPIHSARASDDLSASELARVRADEVWLATTFAGYRAEVLAEATAAEDLAAARTRLAFVLPRYRVVFLLQLGAFFLLLATMGVAICRVLVLRVARDDYCTLADAFGFAWRIRWTGILFPVAVILPIAFLWICNTVAGHVIGIPYLGWIAGIAAMPVLILSSLLIFLIGVAGLTSIALIPATIATERKGTYDSIGKAVNYVFARPLPLILYLVMTALFLTFLHGTLIEGEIVERILTSSVAAIWTGAEFENLLLGNLSELSGFAWFCGLFYCLINWAWQLLLWGMLIAFALGSSVSVFLILRREVDGIDYADIATDPAQR